MPTPPPGGPLLRRFLPQAGASFVPAAAFRPTAADVTGISVSLADLPQPIRRVLADTRKPRSAYSVCQFDLNGISELTVNPLPTEADPGHATIPEIAPPYDEMAKSDARRIQLKEWQEELARRSTVVHNAGDELG